MALIWIVEDDPQIGLLIEMTVRKAGHETRRFANADRLAGGLTYDSRKPDLLLLDLMLRAKSGYEVLRDWKEDQDTRDIPVIIISARSAEQDKVKGLDLGAEDYITKPFGVRELQARVNTALRRLSPAPEKLVFGELELDTGTREAFVQCTRIDLTSREFDLLMYLARHRQTAVTRSELLREVWGYQTDDDQSRTVDSHIKTLRIKLGDNPASPRFIQTIRGTGYRLIAGEAR